MGARMRYDDLPASLKAIVDAQDRVQRDWKTQSQHNTRVAPLNPGSSQPAAKTEESRRREPNKTELDYFRTYLRGMDARYEALTFHMANGHRYTPDWVIFDQGRPIACHECKGGYALHSQQRAKLAFDQCAREFAGLIWSWAVKRDSKWEITNA